jgi:hypothetical protein
MPRLIEWFPAVIDPGASSNSTPDDRREVWVSKAVFDQPVDFDFIYNLQQMPRYFQQLPTNRFLFVVERDIKQVVDAPQCYEIRITYANKWTNTQNSDKPNVTFQFVLDPTLRPALITGGKYTLREGVEFADRYEVKIDDRGNITVNLTEKNSLVSTSAGEPLVMEEEYHRRMFTITKNVKKLSDLMLKGGDYINEDVIQFATSNVRFQKGTLWLWPIDFGHVSVENGFYYFPITMTILYNPKGWLRKVRDAGYMMRSPNLHFKKEDNGRWKDYRPLIPIRGANGWKPDRPVLLNGKGRPIQYVVTGTAPAPDGLTSAGTIPAAGQPPRSNVVFDIQSPEDFGRSFTKEELDKATRHYRTFEWLKFSELPLN